MTSRKQIDYARQTQSFKSQSLWNLLQIKKSTLSQAIKKNDS